MNEEFDFKGLANCSSTLIFYVNGKQVNEANADPEWSLLFYLREKLRLPGSKLGCGEGGCGSCTVMVSSLNRVSGEVTHHTLNACLTPIAKLHGLSVTTVEGIGSTKTRLHVVQERLARAHGTQCGFCTPGFVMSMYTLLRNNATPSVEQIEENLAGNLCRCTGYRPIMEGFASFSEPVFEGCGKVDCCQNPQSEQKIISPCFEANQFTPYDSSQEVIFPPYLKLNSILDEEEIRISGPRVTWYRPVTLQRLLELKSTYPKAKLVVGNTELGIEAKFKQEISSVQIDPSRIKELFFFKACTTGVIIGASLTLSQLEQKFKKLVNEFPEEKTRNFVALLEMLKWLGSKQIKNMASIGGNIMTSSPISDLNPILLAAGAELKLKNINQERKVKMNESFFTGYRKNEVLADEILKDIFIPYTVENEYIFAYKQSRRRDDDLAIVNAAMKVNFEPDTLLISNLILSFGGMAPTTVTAKKTMKSLKGCYWNDELLEKGISLLMEDMILDQSAPGGMVNYRRTLVLRFFFKFFINVKECLKTSNQIPIEEGQICQDVPELNYSRPTTTGNQQFEKASSKHVIGHPIMNKSALKHTTGEATFIDDLPWQENELYASVVLSEKASANIVRIEYEEAFKIKGVHAFIGAKDLSGNRNKTGLIIEDEELFASSEVHYVGQVIGVVVADDKAIAKEAARKVKIIYDEKLPILTLENAMNSNSCWDPKTVESGNLHEGFKTANYTLEGEIHVGGQVHFYMETQSCIAVPHEDGEMEIFSATQNPKSTQMDVAKALGIPFNRVVCKARRLGGGFGGKDTKSGHFAAYVAIAASKLQRPVRIMLDRDEDMSIVGGRHPVHGKWKVGFKKDGSLTALDLQMHANAGYSLDVSDFVAVKAILHADNVYRIPNTRVSFTSYKTNLASNTGCRGFGAPQSMFIMEDILARVGAFLNLEQHQVREINLHRDVNPRTYFGQIMENCSIRRCWDEVLLQANFFDRLKQVELFNKEHTYVKRGLSAIPSKMAASFAHRFLEQAGALVHVYTDGSVLLSHGGVEMGQGLHTKMIQIASQVLNVPVEDIYVSETSTNMVPNTSATAASASSDLNGMAVKIACEKLMERLEPYRRDQPEGNWKQCVESAHSDRISLSACGFYKTPGTVDFDFSRQEGNPYNYFTYGAAVSEVEIDILTGNHTVLQTDIIMDVGKSLNPAIDIGQIEGAFTYGYGLFTLEELQYSPEGKLLTTGPSTYKIPSIRDIPCKFNVSLLKGTSNPRAVYSSRGVGEPPLFLAASVFFAIKEAIRAARPNKDPYRLDSPATAERIRMSCDDKLANKISQSSPSSSNHNQWSIRV